MHPEIVNSPLWDRISAFLWLGKTVCPVEHEFPPEDGSRVLLLDEADRALIAEYLEALSAVDEIRKTIAGEQVRELKQRFPHAYHDVLRFAPYFHAIELPKLSGYALLGGILATMGTPLEVLDFAGLSHTQDIHFPLMKLLKLVCPKGYELCSC